MSIDQVKSQISSIRNNLDELERINDVYQAEQKLKEIDRKIKNTKEEIESINEDSSSLSRPLLNSLKTEEKDLEILENRYNKALDYWKRKRAQEDLKQGKLTGPDALKVQREMGLDNLREVDNQGLMIESIGENIKSANRNLVNINVELDNQGQQMDRIQNHVLGAENQVKQAGKIMTKMETKAKCVQILAFIAVIACGLLDVVLVVFIIYKMFFKNK